MLLVFDLCSTMKAKFLKLSLKTTEIFMYFNKCRITLKFRGSKVLLMAVLKM